MKIKNKDVTKVQASLNEIIESISANMASLDNNELAIYFLQPIMKLACETSDKLFIQTRENENEVIL